MTTVAETPMVLVPAGSFVMGSDRFYPEEAPAHRTFVEAFELDRHPVTNTQFAEFVAATGYQTVAERALDADEYPHLAVAERAPGSLVFQPTAGPVDLRDWRQWWVWTPGANWRHPFGPGSEITDRGDHPVVQVCFADAAAFAEWAGKRLPTEAEWESAAQAGSDDQDYAWGNEMTPHGTLMANTWQGSFPYRNTGARGWVGTSPVGSFPANARGLSDMIGNVWEWTTTVFSPDHRQSQAVSLGVLAPATTGGCGTSCACGPTDSGKPASFGSQPDPAVQRTTKGGSHLCAPEYCRRYRPAARSPQSEDSATTHLGFRCARSVLPPLRVV